MAFLTFVFTLLMYFAAAVFFGGLAYRIYTYAKTPAPLKIPTMPAPLTQGGVRVRMFKEVVFFHSLFRSNKFIWLFGWLFHLGLFVVLFRHLRYATEPVWEIVAVMQPIGVYMGFAMLAGLVGLWARRIFVERIRYITNPSDHLMLGLLVMIAVSGFMMKYVSHSDIVQVKAFALGLLYFDWQAIPADFFFMVHLLLVAALMIVFPFSKLLHAPGVFFSPTRNQVDDAREKRHLAPWAADLDDKRQ